jgi:electron transfer flavoprotein beta subunit
MKILVGIKHVPDTETKVKIAGDGASLDESAVSKWVMSPFDEYALEEAIKIRDERGGEVVLCCASHANAQQTLRQGLAMGADRAISIQHDAYARADGLTRARTLAAVVKSEEIDFVLLGKYGVGTDEGQTGPMLAELLGWPHASSVSELTLSDDGFTAVREVEGGSEHQQGSLPAVISCEKGLNEPRYPSLKGIMQAKKKPIDAKTVDELGLEGADLDGSRVVWEAMELPPDREAGRVIDGEPGTAAAELVRILHEERKVI